MKPLGPRDYGFIGLLAAISLINPLSIHFYLPALSAIEAAFQVTAATAQLTFSVTMFALAAVTLAIGSLSDGLGRKPVLVGGIVLFVGGSLICAVAGGIEALILGRLLQAAGAASGLVLARAIARDVYGLERLTQIIAILTMAYVMGPMISPPLGGAVVDGLGWRWIFWLAASAGALLVVFSVLLIPETRPAGARIQGARAMLGAYRRLFRIPRFSLYVLHTGFVTGAFFAIAAASSFLMTGMLGRPAAEYGLYFLFFPAGYLLGNFIAARIGLRVPIDTMVMAGSVLNLGGAVALAATLWLATPTPLGIFLPGFVVTLSQGLALPSAQSGAIAVDKDLAGTASGIGVFMQMFFGGAASQATGLFADGTPTPMILVVLPLAVAAVAVSLALGRLSAAGR
ncbi:MAG: multidrug effflux MFS transporter [Defluviicoccus sp.]|nr:multidrug effflux MFS transporter [Defluviicoccus sp.]